MKRTVCLLLAALLLAVWGLALGEADTSVLEGNPALTEYLEEGGVDTVWRPLSQPFFGQAGEGSLCGFLDIVELADTGLLVLRLTVSLELDEPLEGERVTFTLGKESWSFPVQRRTSEYDMVYQEDYGAVLAGDGLGLAKALAKSKSGALAFSLTGTREISGSLTITKEAASEVWKLYQAAGGDKQDFTGSDGE